MRSASHRGVAVWYGKGAAYWRRAEAASKYEASGRGIVESRASLRSAASSEKARGASLLQARKKGWASWRLFLGEAAAVRIAALIILVAKARHHV